jgi:LCP family protein required for cell wall assembly
MDPDPTAMDPELDGPTDTEPTPPASSPSRSPALAALLSFLWPGLGQWYVGRGMAAVLYAIPPLLVAVGLLSLALGGLESLVARLLDPSVALLVLAGIGASAVWRLASILHAWWVAVRREQRLIHDDQTPTPRRRLARVGALVALGVIVLAVHAVPGWWAFAFYRAGTAIFQPPQTSDVPLADLPVSTPGASLAPGSSPGPVESFVVPASPIPTRPPVQDADDGFQNVLFVGVDSTPYRRPEHRLTDSMILASFDRTRHTLQMISIPRNITRFPQYWGGTHEQKLNQLLLEAQTNPELYPDGPMGTLVGQISFLLGVDIDHYATVDILGFQRLVDVVGGVDVVVTDPIEDPGYEPDGFFLDAGPQHLDGATAVKYVRSRKGGGSNAERSLRQQQILLQLRKKLSDPTIMVRLPEVLDAVASTVRTDLPPDGLDEALALARESQGATAGQIWLGPPRYAVDIPATDIDLENAAELRMDQVAALSLELWGDASRYSDSGYYQSLVGR